ncbi:hypothetical protein EOD39_11907 [Acipenser ruthenus]|uniref:Uncharacterized protein n=1 Tax=Acipenser ruthenus TaxID=7906 RepID=A0A662YRG5_ACIRT|nr:hypothetical protein EOD39_11907 [Acipenser ruthenus]
MSFHDCVRCGASFPPEDSHNLCTQCLDADHARRALAAFMLCALAFKRGLRGQTVLKVVPPPLALRGSRGAPRMSHLRTAVLGLCLARWSTRPRKQRSADVSALRAQMVQLASTVANQQSLLECLVNLTAAPAPTPAFGVLETPSAPALVPALPQSQLIEEE